MIETTNALPPPANLSQVANANPPSPQTIDEAIEAYNFALSLAKAADKAVDDEKAKLMFLVEHFGSVPAHAEQSKRLIGVHTEATITWSTSFVVNEPGVEQLRDYLFGQNLGGLFGRFFAPVTKHKMVDGARDVLKTLTLSNRVRERIASLVGLAIDVRTSAPSLKVKTVQPEKPVRTKKAKAA